MRYKTPFIYALVLVLLTTGGCTRPRKPGVVTYIPVPEGYLQECELPAVPENTGGLSDAFAKAYLCGEQGNKDKERIRNLPRD